MSTPTQAARLTSLETQLGKLVDMLGKLTPASVPTPVKARKAAKTAKTAKVAKRKTASQVEHARVKELNAGTGRMSTARYICADESCKGYWYSADKSVAHTAKTGHSVNAL